MIKTILVLADDSPVFEATLRSTRGLAEQLEAHIDALFIHRAPATAAALGLDVVHPGVMEELTRATTLANEERERRARAIFDHVIAEVPAKWRVATGYKTEIAPAAARVCDLTVVGRPSDSRNSDWQREAESVLFNSGRPVLLLPHNQMDDFVGKPIAIGWNGSPGAARALMAALPLLKRAEQADILTSGPLDAYADTADIVMNLSRHGVKTIARRFDANELTMGKALLEQCHLWRDRLLVMGAYGHSRMRRLILSGTTRQILNEADLPVLMMH